MTYHDYMRRCSAEFVASLLVRHGGNVSAAARSASINRQYLHELMRRHGLTGREQHRGNERWRALQ